MSWEAICTRVACPKCHVSEQTLWLWTCLPWMGKVLRQPRYSNWSACHIPCPNNFRSPCKEALHRQSTGAADFQSWSWSTLPLTSVCWQWETSFQHKLSACLAWSANPRVHWKGGKGHQQTACFSLKTGIPVSAPCAPSVTLSMPFK